MPGFLKIWSTPVQAFEALYESDLTFDEDDLESICSYQILVVDDKPADSRLIQMQLEQKGFKHISPSSNGPEALKMVEKSLFDVVIVDMHLPAMNGFEVARRIKSQAAYQSIPLIGVSGRLLDCDESAYVESGLEMVLSKPVDLHELISCIKKHRDNLRGITSQASHSHFRGSSSLTSRSAPYALPDDFSPKSLRSSSEQGETAPKISESD